MVDKSVQRKTVNLTIIFVWKEVYVVGEVDADSSGESDDSKSDKVTHRDRRGYILINFKSRLFSQIMNPNSFENEVGD